ncbi:aldo-keto reductase-like protein [Apiospora sp. TS-2023a]
MGTIVQSEHLSQDPGQAFELKEVPNALARSIAATKVEYRRVGASGLIVSNPILGTLGLGGFKMDELGQRRGRDTANAYSNGMTEAIIGRMIKDFKIPRNKLVLMTKVGRIVADTENGGSSDLVAFLDDAVRKSKDYVNQYGLSRMAILNAVEQSLNRLQSTYIDVLHIHRWDPDTPIEETMGTLHGLVTSGKVRYLAASSMWAFELAQLQCVAELRGWTKIVAMQNHYNLLYREEEREMIKFCKRTGVGILVRAESLRPLFYPNKTELTWSPREQWSPLAEGYLARPFELADGTARPARFTYRSNVDREIIGRVQLLAQKYNVAASQVALAWLNKRVTSAIVGINSVERMDEVLGAHELVLTDEEDTWLEELYRPKSIQGHC